ESISKFDLTLFINDTKDFELAFEYNTVLFKKESVEKLISDLNILVNKVIIYPKVDVHSLLWHLRGQDESAFKKSKVALVDEDF
ncbi:MAG: hypothetical protein ACJA2S_002230, partial [Cyclobacteriaceae bacterium]